VTPESALTPSVTTSQWIAATAVAVPAVGWFIASALQSQREVRQHRIATVIEYTGRQLEELYGPLLTLLIEGEQAWHACLRSLQLDPGDPAASERLRRVLLGEDDQRGLAEDEISVWVFWIEHAFFPRNDRIQELLASKAHLIEGPPEGLLVPRSYVQFLQHHNDWKMRHLQWKEQGRPYPWCWTTSWPDSFYAEVWVTFETLARRHSEFLKLQRTQGLIEGGFRLPDYAHPGASETPAGARSAG
jgi:hypothetical protein